MLLCTMPRMIFEKAGASTGAAMLQAVAVGITNMLFTIIAMFFIDKLGRKTLLLIGAVGMCCIPCMRRNSLF